MWCHAPAKGLSAHDFDDAKNGHFRHGPSSLTRGNGAATSYGYDTASRLSDLDHNLAGTSHDELRDFAFNPASQIISRAGSNVLYRYLEHENEALASVYNGLNQPTSIGGVAISHDKRGNLTSDGTTTYGYDVDNRLVSGTGGAALKYDGSLGPQPQ